MSLHSPKYLMITLLLLLANSHAATYFVRSGASGNGTSWANAWGNVSSISWSGLNAGDTVCIAGGTYSGGISTAKSGTSSNPISIRRATAADSTCGSGTTGWNSAYDAQVVMTGNIGIGSNYVSIDGMVPNGITVIMQNPSSEYDGITTNTGTAGITLRNIEVAGPNASGTTNPVTQNGDHRSLRIEHWNGSNWDAHSNWLVQYVNFHGACNNFVIYGAQNMVIEHSRFADSGTNGTAACHPNVGNLGSNGTVTFRYNEIVNWQVEGLMLLSGGGTWYVYGNIWHDPMPGSYPRVAEAQESAQTIYLYNNTFVNLYYICASTSNAGTWSSSSQARNNLFYGNNFSNCGLSDQDYDWADGSTGESHGQNSGANPFTSLSAHNFHLTGHTTAGLNLGSPYNVDYDGNTRTTWDRGAFEFASGTIAPPTGLAALVH